jgi:Ankyrin repeat
MRGKPQPPQDALGGAAYTLSVPGTEFLLQLGVRVVDDAGRRLAPVDVVLETDSRKPAAKHAILRLYETHGLVYPDTPVMAVHRGRIDLLDAHVRRDPGVVNRRFAFAEMYPPELGCHDEVLATHGTPLGGATLLHLCVDYDELEIARWLLAHGADPDTPATIDDEGFGGHTALFATLVSQPAFWMNHGHRSLDASATRLLLDHGADVNVRCSLRKQLHPGYGAHEVMREYRDVTPLSWGQRFHRKEFVNAAGLSLVEAAGGRA